MAERCTIRYFNYAALDIPLLTPFGISGGSQATANNVLVSLTLEDGTIGYGEAAPLPPYNGETQADVLEVYRSSMDWLVGQTFSDWKTLSLEFSKRYGHSCGSAQCGFEMALLDALTQRNKTSLWKFFGGNSTELETDMTVTTGTPAEGADAARAIIARGINQIKVKVGGAKGIAYDLERLKDIHAVAPHSPLIIDGNAGLSRAEARLLVDGLRSADIAPALLEQWLAKDDLEGMRDLGIYSGWLIAADESVSHKRDAEKVAHLKAAQVINVKLMKAGIVSALEIANVARINGIGLMIGGNVESILAMTVSACFAAGQGGFTFADLDTPLFLASNPFSGGYSLNGGKISVAHIKEGHGVIPL
jgi:hypothetical protein